MSELSADLPILVGVTGHRDILPDALPLVQNAVRAALRALRVALGPSLMLMTALAEGADQLVADIAKELGIRMIAVSPMPLELYRLTMETADGAAALQRLWNDSLVVQRLELPLVNACDPAQQDATQYEQLGLLLSRQSHILLALWNGHDAEPRASRSGPGRRTRGGSSHVIAMRQMGERGEVKLEMFRNSLLFSGPPPLLETGHSGPILHVVTPRQRDGGAICQDGMMHPRAPGALLWWSDLPARAPHQRWKWLRNVLWLNELEQVHDHVKMPSWRVVTAVNLRTEMPTAFHRIRQAAECLAQRATPDTGGCKTGDSLICPASDLTPTRDLPPLRRLRHLFNVADSDASHIQNRLFGTWLPGLPWPKRGRLQIGLLLWFALAVPFATICFEIFKEYGRQLSWLGLYIAAILGPSLVYLLTAIWGWQGRYQDHRALAEGLRVQFFWAASGVPFAVSDNYLRHQTGTLGWIRLALRGPALDGLAAALAVGTPDPVFVRERWVKDQMAYFRMQSHRQAKAGVAMQRATRIAVVSLLLLAIVLFLLLLEGEGLQPPVPEWLVGVLIVMLGVLPAIAAFFVIIGEGRAYQEHAHAYTQAYNVFAEAERQSQNLHPGDVAAWRELLLALGQEALTENAAWINTHRGRPVANKIG